MLKILCTFLNYLNKSQLLSRLSARLGYLGDLHHHVTQEDPHDIRLDLMQTHFSLENMFQCSTIMWHPKNPSWQSLSVMGIYKDDFVPVFYAEDVLAIFPGKSVFFLKYFL